MTYRKIITTLFLALSLAIIGCNDNGGKNNEDDEPGTAVDTGLENETDSTNETDTNALCTAEARAQCVDGDVYWFDSCGEMGTVKELCPTSNAACYDVSETEAACACLDHWTGDDCQTCPEHGDATQDCEACLPGFNGRTCDHCVRYVNSDASGATPDGLTWESGFATPQEGIDAAAAADPVLGTCHVWVMAGTYHIFQTDVGDTLTLAPDVQLYGGFDGSELDVADRDPEANPTMLDGSDAATQSLHVQHVVTVGRNVTHPATSAIDGVVITGGSILIGGGMGISSQGSFRLANSIITANTSDLAMGGGLNNSGDHTIVENCTFFDNRAGVGGGVYNTGDNVTFENCTFLSNEASMINNLGTGGAIFNTGDHLTIEDCDFDNNAATGSGGGIYSHHNLGETLTLTISNTTFQENTSADPLMAGGAVFQSNGILSVDDTIFSLNSSVGDGGAVFLQNVNAVFSRVTWDENWTEGNGGGLCVMHNSIVDLTNCVFAQNTSAIQGAAVYFQGENVTTNNPTANIVHCTFHGNSCGTDDTGAIYGTNGAPSVIANSIVWNNTPDDFKWLTDVTLSHSIINKIPRGEWIHDEAVMENTDPLFVDAAKGDLHLLPDSPGVDAGDDDVAPATDRDDNPRIDGPDIGAYEIQPGK